MTAHWARLAGPSAFWLVAAAYHSKRTAQVHGARRAGATRTIVCDPLAGILIVTATSSH